MSGLESIPRVRAGHPAARVVAMSTSDLLPNLCLAVGACAVVTASGLERLDRVLGGLEVVETVETA